MSAKSLLFLILTVHVKVWFLHDVKINTLDTLHKKAKAQLSRNCYMLMTQVAKKLVPCRCKYSPWFNRNRTRDTRVPAFKLNQDKCIIFLKFNTARAVAVKSTTPISVQKKCGRISSKFLNRPEHSVNNSGECLYTIHYNSIFSRRVLYGLGVQKL